MERTPNTEETPRDGPIESDLGRLAIYAASLSDYNAGILHGNWIDATEDVDGMQVGVDRMLGKSPTANVTGQPAEEWAVHDHAGFAPLALPEYVGLQTVARLVAGIREHGRPFAVWAAFNGSTEEEVLGRFDHAYLGEWTSLEAYAENVLEDLGLDEVLDRAVPEGLRPYVLVDAEGFARDLELSGDVATVETRGDRRYVFDLRE